ncbi:MAG TPA: sulfotransferase [Thermoleophilaceae bacterium]|nr:sulfotransferase [Thermoleophilaceae bacterium]
MLPNLVIIGAAKSGTTALHRYLAEHPDVFMSEQKELQYFQLDDWESRRSWYEAQFPVESPVRGEASPIYTFYPFCEGVARRMGSLIPDAKLIYIVRDPIERFVAHYVEHFALRIVTRPFAEVASDRDPRNQVLAASRYASQLEQYLDAFPAEQILVIDQDDLRIERRDTLRRVFSFLEIAPDFWSRSFEVEHNQRKDVSLNGLGRWLYLNHLLEPLQRAGGRLPRPVRRTARRAIGPSVHTPELTDEMRSTVAEALREDVQRFRQLTGQRFAGWSI